MHHFLFLIAAGLLAPWITAAEPVTYAVDPKASTVAFTGHSTFHDFSGTATVTEGKITLDGAHSSGAVVVDAASMDTRKEARDKDMRKDMESATYPVIRYALTSVTQADDHFMAHGTWTMHGVDKDLDIPFSLEPGAAAKLSAAFVIDFNDFKVVVPRSFGMKVDPKVDVRVVLALKPGAPAAVTQSAP